MLRMIRESSHLTRIGKEYFKDGVSFFIEFIVRARRAFAPVEPFSNILQYKIRSLPDEELRITFNKMAYYDSTALCFFMTKLYDPPADNKVETALVVQTTPQQPTPSYPMGWGDEYLD